MSQQTFEASLDRFRELLDGRLDEAQRGTAVIVANAVSTGAPAFGIPGTPVDTGYARGGWVIGVNRAPTFTRPPRRPKDGAVPAPAPLTAALVDVGAEDTVTIANNTEYIGRLEYGSSTQAPAGFVRLTLEALPRIVSAIAARWRR